MIGTEALGWGRFQERITIWPQLVTGTLNKDVVLLLSLLLWRGRINTATIRKIADSRVSKPPCSGALPLLSAVLLCLMTHPVFLCCVRVFYHRLGPSLQASVAESYHALACSGSTP
jgi:hypothetical protein